MISLLLSLVSSYSRIKARVLCLNELEERPYFRVRPQRFNRIEMLCKILFAEERMNHAMTDFMQTQDGKGFRVRFIFFLLPVLLGIEVMSRHLAMEWATAEGACSRLNIGHRIVFPFRMLPWQFLCFFLRQQYVD
jgi:hypothetical protein